MKKVLFLTGLYLLSCFLTVKANNVQITNVTTTVTGSVTTVNFNIKWDNSWRGGPANNRDAVWVFIKFYDINGVWQPLRLIDSGYTIPAALNLEIPSDKAGAFVSRSTDGMGNIASSSIKLRVQQQPGSFDVKVFGLEMVYIPQGPFYAGFYNTPGTFNYGDGNSAAPFLINTTYPPQMGNLPGQLWDPRTNGSLNSNFPTGYNAFYIMKYELSQGGYRDFLNSLTQYSGKFLPERSDLTISNFNVKGTLLFNTGARNYLEVSGTSPSPFVGSDGSGNNIFDENNDGEWVACGSLFWSDAAAFLDWACLRPMTELEYEKAANGPDPLTDIKFATGTYLGPPKGAILNSKTSAETQARTSNSNYINTAETNIGGPMRNGYVADATSDRLASGGSYYGVMELSGNLWEPVVTTGNTAGRSFKGNLGDGILSPNGSANQATWPGIKNDGSIANTSGVISKINTAGIVAKGGSFADESFFSVTSYLWNPADYPATRSAAKGYGCRGVRQQ